MSSKGMTFKIDKGVPLPVNRIGAPRGECPYPFAQMAVGDSFVIGDASRNMQREVYMWAKRYRERNGNPRFAICIRTQADTARVWRIDDREPKVWHPRPKPLAPLVAVTPPANVGYIHRLEDDDEPLATERAAVKLRRKGGR